MESQATPKKRTRTRKVDQPPNEKVELTVEEPIENKYAPKKKIGSNTRPKNVVNTVGLGKLKVETINGYTDG